MFLKVNTDDENLLILWENIYNGMICGIRNGEIGFLMCRNDINSLDTKFPTMKYIYCIFLKCQTLFLALEKDNSVLVQTVRKIQSLVMQCPITWLLEKDSLRWSYVSSVWLVDNSYKKARKELEQWERLDFRYNADLVDICEKICKLTNQLLQMTSGLLPKDRNYCHQFYEWFPVMVGVCVEKPRILAKQFRTILKAVW